MATRIAEARAYGPADADWLSAHFANASAEAMVAAALTDPGFGRVAVVSSFGAESAVLLDLVAQVDAGVPVLFVNTGRLFPETLSYAADLSAFLGLRDVRWLEPEADALAAKDPHALRWSYDPDGCCAIRKVAPLAAGIAGFDSWLSGRKRFQAGTRAGLSKVEQDGARLKINPLADWDATRLSAHMAARRLPPHPLVAEGYPSIGCSPCTTKVAPGEDPRAGRWRGWDKTECGIHAPLPGSEPSF
jgi:phosphoadenosine phosphosulfate reductase